jgi:hypothetical protein
MTISDLFNITGILILMFGGCFGLLGSFSEKNEDIVTRTGNSFGNIEHYKSMISQKYFNIFSFFFITFGSFLLLIPFFLNKDFGNNKICKPYLVILSIITLIILCGIGLSKWTFYKIDRITIRNQIILLSQKPTKNLDDHNLSLIIEILIQRKVKTNFADFDEIIVNAKKHFKIK